MSWCALLHNMSTPSIPSSAPSVDTRTRPISTNSRLAFMASLKFTWTTSWATCHGTFAVSDYLARCFTQDKLSSRLSEYKTDKGTWAMQWGARGFTPAIDRGTVPSITYFRNADHALVTHAYGEMREIGASFRLLPDARTTALELEFYPFGRLNSDGLHDQYVRKAVDSQMPICVN